MKHKTKQLMIAWGVELAAFFAAVGVIWLLWGYVLSSFWPDGPPGLVKPGFLPFLGLLVLFVFFVRVARKACRQVENE